MTDDQTDLFATYGKGESTLDQDKRYRVGDSKRPLVGSSQTWGRSRVSISTSQGGVEARPGDRSTTFVRLFPAIKHHQKAAQSVRMSEMRRMEQHVFGHAVSDQFASILDSNLHRTGHQVERVGKEAKYCQPSRHALQLWEPMSDL